MITPEQRDQVPLCGARKKNKELCRAFAGQGTNHPGTGRCKFHAGATPNHSKAAIRREVTKRMVTLGEPVTDVSPMAAIMQELAASVGHTAYLNQEIHGMSNDELGSPYGLTVLSLYQAERDRKARIARVAIESGADEAMIRVQEAQLSLLGQALARACDTAGVSAPLRKRIGAALREELAAVEARPH